LSYLLMMVEPIGQREARGEAEGRIVYDRMLAFGRELTERGVLLASQSLKSTDSAVRLTRKAGRSTLVDGPFAEAKEMIGGFFLLDVGTYDEALAIAEACPAAEWCTIEIREVGPCFA
jgi:hypothetical protein